MFFLVTGLVCMVIMVLGAGQFAAMIPNPGAKLSIMCLAPAVLTCCLMSAYRGYYQGMQNMYPTSISQIIEAVTKMIFGLGLSGAVLYLTQREYQNTQTVLGVSYSSYEQAQAVIAQIASAAAVLGVSLSTVSGVIVSWDFPLEKKGRRRTGQSGDACAKAGSIFSNFKEDCDDRCSGMYGFAGSKSFRLY